MLLHLLRHKIAVGFLLAPLSIVTPVRQRAQGEPSARVQSKSYNVIFKCACDDTISQGYAQAFRELLASSGRFTELPDTDENRKHSLVVRSVSMSMSEDRDKQVSLAGFATVLTASDAYLDLYVQKCGRFKPGDCAKTIFDKLDDIVTRSEAAHN